MLSFDLACTLMHRSYEEVTSGSMLMKHVYGALHPLERGGTGIGNECVSQYKVSSSWVSGSHQQPATPPLPPSSTHDVR